MTEIYKAGEHVKIVRTDSLYSDELGDQTGLVGTINRTPSHSAGVYVTFPHTGDNQWYYLQSEIARAHGTTPLPEPLKEGDWVKVTLNNLWKDTIGEVKSITNGEVRITIDTGTNLYFSVKDLEKTTKPVPKPKFKVGDWVEVTGYSSRWNGAKGEVTLVGAYEGEPYGHSIVIKTAGDAPMASGGFSEKYLKATEKPFVTKFKIGDWVKVTNWSSSYNGTVYQITEVPADEYSYYRFKNAPGVGFRDAYLEATTEPYVPKFKVGDWVKVVNYNSSTFEGRVGQITGLPAAATGNLSYYTVTVGTKKGFIFTEDQLEAAEEPHWSITKPVGATAQVKYSGGGLNRVIVKTGEDEWLHLYQDENGKVTVTAKRNNARTKALFNRSPYIEWAVPEV